MGARRIRRQQRQADMAESRRRNGFRKQKERARRTRRVLETILTGRLPFPPCVMSWLSDCLSKPSRRLTQVDVDRAISLADGRRLFYRVLDPDTKARWDAALYNGTHRGYPDRWRVAWQALTAVRGNGPHDLATVSRDDFWLSCPGWGIHTAAAREAFLTRANVHGVGHGVWPDNVLIQVGELEGTCAWEKASQAWSHAVPGLANETHIVKFFGKNVCTIPEAKGGGVQVQEIETIEIYTAEEFAEVYGFEMPEVPAESGEIPLGDPEGVEYDAPMIDIRRPGS